ncbi:hypothetical protein GUITHDRAFT_158687 [Guillardia theta CCMP2712]|uniref:Cullin family profile domain-containing protein n=1 Tax=Guillardia theta (strain CCMP2712) TaxID=905079 RepID=L1IJD4_GUITC|nr:hypothetical protein GUITHDRAFT_158687 [Guillardia theta CCMP2712]EKX36222.1 hypothetical protein GUITHDRAFT_158687 [Guillardia theta CCMP2712]|eukprot:XP_005823202.1 hypothetical protein GUITHDRAFT_158687 [Guillardia theta CCMP2712]
MQEGFDKFIEIMEGGFREPFALSLHSELYTNCYAMCTQKAPNNYADQLYQKYGMIYETYLHATVLPAIKSKKGEAMLHEFAKRWKNHKLLVRQMWKLFVYLDRFYIKRISGLPLKAVGVQKFEQVVFNAVKEDVRAGILGMIEKEREGEDVDRELLKSVVNVKLGDIGAARFNVYNKELEQNLLATTSEFYARESAQWIATDSCPEYMKKAENRLQQEVERVHAYLHSVSEEKLLKECENQLLAVHQTALLDKEETGCRALLREGKTEDLARMYKLFTRLPNSPDCGLQPISQIVREHIVDVGMSLVRKQEGEKDHSNYAQQLIELHDQYLALVNGPFGNNTLFQKVLKEAFEVFVNKDIGSTTTAELLSSFCDNIMKTGGDKIEGEIDSILDKIVMLFSYLSDKDMFAEYYRKQLAKRLLLNRSASDDDERSLITKLKYRCGAQFTSKLEGMLTDMNVSKDGQNNFTQWMKNNDINLGMECSVTVLTTGFWPTYKVDEVNLPNELVKCVDKFTQFYESRTSHRKLKWIHTLGTCVVLGRFDPKPIDLVISTYQACILMLYNQQEEYTTQEIANATKLPMEELKKYLQTLALSKYQILTKTPKGKEIADSDVFTFNRKFTDRQRKIKMSLLVTKDEKLSTKQTVDEDRKHAVEASIVRVMKARKTMAHQQLVMEVSQQLMKLFKPDPKVIKNRIESLISREYLERDKDNNGVYKYLA